MYDTLRPKLIHETNIDILCELVDILKVEVLGEQLSRRSGSLAGLRPTLERILADVHERLTFRARTHIRDEVCYYIVRTLDYSVLDPTIFTFGLFFLDLFGECLNLECLLVLINK